MSKNDPCGGSAGTLREAVHKLYKVLSPTVVAESGLDENNLSEGTDNAQGAPTNEGLLAAVSTHLSAVLSSREYAQDSFTDTEGPSTSTHSVVSQVTQLLSEVEQRVQETEGFWTSASAPAPTSFLNVAAALIEGDVEVAQRMQHLLALSQQPEIEKTHGGLEEERIGSWQVRQQFAVCFCRYHF